MFRGLRLRLTSLYVLAALALVTLTGSAAYGLVQSYFQTITDLALQHRMADEFEGLAAPVPAELAVAERAWYARRSHPLPPLALLPDLRPDPAAEPPDGPDDDAYDGELAAIFVLPLSADGHLLFDPNATPAPMPPDRAAAAAAFAQGSDWRETRRPDGGRVRLLTYRVTRPDGPAMLQLGRTLTDQDRALTELLIGLVGVGGLGAILLGLGGWWLAGRSLRPAQLAWEGQQAFVANASHELRTPLTLIRASVEVTLRNLPPGGPHRRLLQDVLQECDHMSRLVGDLLLLSRMDAGQLPVQREVVVLADLLADIQRQVGRLADERGIALTVEAATGAAWGDLTRLRQVVLILLDNALRHTLPGGQVRLASHPTGGRVRLTVTDTGEGIPADYLPHLFERFSRPDGARSEAVGGAGLGLAIARGLVEAQHGQIAVASERGVGTRVTVTLPAARVAIGRMPTATPDSERVATPPSTLHRR